MRLQLYIGTYTGGDGEGIYLSQFDSETGVLSEPRVVAKTENPTFLTVHPEGRFVYAVSEVRQRGERAGGAVHAYSRDPQSGELCFLNARNSGGAGPCHVALDRSARVLFAANYSSGSVSAFSLRSDGTLDEAFAFFQHEGSSVNPRRQEGPHAHSTTLSPDNRFAFVCDLGTDQVMIYELDPSEPTLTPADPSSAAVAPGEGPRHIAIHPSGKFVYVINEMGSTVTAFAYQPDGKILCELKSVSTLPRDFTGESTTAEVVVSEDGRFLYGSNRGHDSIAVFEVDANTGNVSPVQIEPTRGAIPRNFIIDPTGNFLLAGHQNSDTITVFRRDAGTGRLEFADRVIEVPSPVCLRFAPMP
jgi:6-phosphogluconolactonase